MTYSAETRNGRCSHVAKRPVPEEKLAEPVRPQTGKTHPVPKKISTRLTISES